jgi:hypothetical protein
MASKPTSDVKRLAVTARRNHSVSGHEREAPLEVTPADGVRGGNANPMMLSQNNLLQMQRTVGNSAVGRLLSRSGGSSPLTIQRQIKVGAEDKSVAWITVSKFNNTDSAYDILKVIEAAKETFTDYDALTTRVNELSNLVKVYKYLANHKAAIVENAGSPYPADGEDGVNTYSREYKFAGVESLLIHVHWKKKGTKHIDVAKAHFKSLSNKFEKGRSLDISISELKSIGLPTKGIERLND